jgi:hypothetical protein
MSTTIGRLFILLSSAVALTLSPIGCAAADPQEEDPEAAALAEEATLGTGEDELVSFRCDATPDQDISGRGHGSGHLRKVRAAAHPARGFDRFVMEFTPTANPKAYFVRREPGTTFEGTCSPPECPPTRVAGEDAIRVVYQNGGMLSTYRGPLSLKPSGTTAIKEVAQYDQFETNVEWAIGTKKNPCFRTWTLTSPPRLIVDVKR